jgi:WD40 repeat protein
LATKAQAAAERAEADALTQAKLVTQEKQKATRNLFDSHLTRASLIAQNEDFQSAIAALSEAEAMLSTEENKEIITTNRLSTLAMLDWFTDINSGLLENRLRDHGARWHALALHPQTERLAVVGEFGQVQLLSTNLERDEKQSLTGHATEDSIVRCVDFAPDGTWFATSGDDGKIIRWQVSNDEGEAKRLDQWRASSSIKSLQITPDGKHIVSGGASKFIILSNLTGVEIWRSEELIDEVVTIAIEQAPSPSAPLLVACSDKSGYVYNWDLQPTGKGYMSAPNTPVTRSLDIGFVLSLDFHVDTLTGTRLAGGSTEGDVFIWQTHSTDAELRETTQATQQLRGHSNAINALVFESSRRLLSASSDRTLREWNIASGITEKLFQGHATGVRGIAIEGSSVYSASVGGEIIHWDLETEEDSVHKTFHGEWISAVAAMPHGKHMAANSGSTVKIFDPSANEVRTLATPETRQPLGSADQTFISRMDYNQAGSRLAATSIDGTVTFWNNISGGEPPRVLTPLGKGVVINDLTFSPDHSGRWLIGVGDFGTSSDEFNGNPKLTQKKKTIQRRGAGGAVFVYDTIADEAITLGTPAPETLAICFYPESISPRFLTGGSGGNVRHWTIDSANNNRVSSPSVIGDFGKLEDSEAIATIAINSQGTLIAIGGRSGSIQVFDGDAKRKTVLEGHENTIVDLSFHPCGTILLSLSADQTIKAWDLDGLSSVDFADSNLQSSALLFTLRLPLPKSSNESSWEVWDFDVWWNSTAETSIGNIYIPATEYNRANPNLFKGYLMHYPILTERF